MIRKRSPFPFETIAAAIAFSPRIEALLCEVHRLAHLHRARLILIHIGIKTIEKQKKLDELLMKHNFGAIRYEVIWRTGDTVDSILKVCKENVVDLLIAGALEKESILKYYIGSISREICRKAKCSVLMLTEPSVLPKPLKKIIVNGIDHPKTSFTIETAVYMAKFQKATEMIIVKELNMMAMAMNIADDSSEGEVKKIKQSLYEEGNDRLEGILNTIDKDNLNIKMKSITGKLGYSIGNYAATHGANLLVINSPDNSMNFIDRLFPHDIEYILENLPCNLLIVHSRH
jgi:hypothetical protein